MQIGQSAIKFVGEYMLVTTQLTIIDFLPIIIFIAIVVILWINFKRRK